MGTGRGMHEHHAVEALVERLTSALGDPEFERVTEVRIRAGAAFSPEALEQAYEMLTQDTSLGGSHLTVEELAERRTCAACGTSWTVTREDVAGHLVLCASCGTPSPIEGGAGIEVLGMSWSAASSPRAGT